MALYKSVYYYYYYYYAGSACTLRGFVSTIHCHSHNLVISIAVSIYMLTGQVFKSTISISIGFADASDSSLARYQVFVRMYVCM